MSWKSSRVSECVDSGVVLVNVLIVEFVNVLEVEFVDVLE
jgi:hypothetical protein